MKKSNIVLAIIAGAAIGGIVAIILQAEKAIINEQQNDTEDGAFEKIAQQFSDKISSDLKTAETKIKSTVKSNGFLKPDEETGVFL